MRAAGKTRYEDAVRVHRIVLDRIPLGQYRQGLAAPEDVLVVSRARRADKDDAKSIEYRRPFAGKFRLVPGRHEHKQRVTVGRLLRGQINDEFFSRKIDGLIGKNLAGLCEICGQTL